MSASVNSMPYERSRSDWTLVTVVTTYCVLDEVGRWPEREVWQYARATRNHGTKLSRRHCGDGSRHAHYYENERKSDRRDAMMLAHLARMDPTLLHPLEHVSQEAQQDMLPLKLRDSLVRARVALINAVLFTLKSLGYPVSR